MGIASGYFNSFLLRSRGAELPLRASYLLTAAIVLGTLVLINTGVVGSQDVPRVTAAQEGALSVLAELVAPAVIHVALIHVCRHRWEELCY